MSHVALQGLEFHAKHGVYSAEQELGARFTVDLELHYPFAHIGDDLAQAVNYAEVYAAVQEVVTGQPFQLIEALAAAVARRLLREFPKLERVQVRVHKPFAPLPGIFRDVSADLELWREREAKVAYVALGSNLGWSLDNLAGAIVALMDDGHEEVCRVSRVYRTAPVGGPPDQPPYLNAVVALRTMRTAAELLDLLLLIEEKMGRDRAKEQRWGPRLLDLDLILYADQVQDDPALTLPHPRAWDRAFVLAPLSELAPRLERPVTGETVADALARVGQAGVEAVSGEWSPQERWWGE